MQTDCFTDGFYTRNKSRLFFTCCNLHSFPFPQVTSNGISDLFVICKLCTGPLVPAVKVKRHEIKSDPTPLGFEGTHTDSMHGVVSRRSVAVTFGNAHLFRRHPHTTHLRVSVHISESAHQIIYLFFWKKTPSCHHFLASSTYFSSDCQVPLKSGIRAKRLPLSEACSQVTPVTDRQLSRP